MSQPLPVFRKFALCSACLVGLSFPAQSADIADVAPTAPVAPEVIDPARWTGPYAGLHAGYAWGDSDWVLDPGSWWGNDPIFSGTLSPDGFIGGAQIGYLHQTNNLVFGVDVSATGANMKDTIVSPAWPGIDTWESEVEFLALGQMRLGVAWENWLLFAQGGIAAGFGEATGLSTDGPTDISNSRWHTGWTAGGGVLFKPNQRWSFGAEYSYIDLGSTTYDLYANNASQPVDVDFKIHAAKATVNFHFGDN